MKLAKEFSVSERRMATLKVETFLACRALKKLQLTLAEKRTVKMVGADWLIGRLAGEGHWKIIADVVLATKRGRERSEITEMVVEHANHNSDAEQQERIAAALERCGIQSG